MSRQRKHTRRTHRSLPRGVLVARAGGFGFVATAEGEYFIPASGMRGAFDGDLVEIAPICRRKKQRRGGSVSSKTETKESDKPAARVVRVLDRAHDTIIGRYEVAEPFGVVVPENQRIPYDIFTMRSENPDVPDGALVRVRITQFPSRHSAATGVVEEVIGTADEPTIGIDLIVARHKLETEFSAATLEEAKQATLDEIGALADGYRDIRDRFVFTIDPADAKDFDDALSLEWLPSFEGAPQGGWRLGVHIADVSHYVPWNSSIDLEARRRATSVYLVDRVIPMLPHELSNELCSLKPHEDRRSMTVDIYLRADGTVVSYDPYQALICSNARLSYDEALILIEEEPASEMAQSLAQGILGQVGLAGGTFGPDDLIRRIKEAASLAQLREELRNKDGNIEFHIPEIRVTLDEEGAPLGISVRAKTAATRLVEEAMILANEVIASHLTDVKFPCAYRVHEAPSSDALAALVPIFQEFSWFTAEEAAALPMGDPATIQNILATSERCPESELVSTLLLRAMNRALYRPVNDGHYGLGSDCYCHFTSPIRRYPDLLVHRFLRASLTKRPEKFDQEVAALPWMCEHSSDMEKVADTAARESQVYKMVEMLKDQVGETFSGTISGVTSHGLYVRLECSAEGFLPMRALGREYFSFDPNKYILVGSETGKTYRLGHHIAVVLAVAEVATSKLEFKLAKPNEK